MCRVNGYINPFSKRFNQAIDEFDGLSSIEKGVTIALTVITGLASIFVGGIAGWATFRGLVDEFKQKNITPLHHQGNKKTHQTGKKTDKTWQDLHTKYVKNESPPPKTIGRKSTPKTTALVFQRSAELKKVHYDFVAPGHKMTSPVTMFMNPTDHLPVMAKFFFGKEALLFVSYNILHRNYMRHFNNVAGSNMQGLHGSAITTLDVQRSKYPTLNAREALTVNQLLDMVRNPHFSKAFIGLQECSPAVHQVIESELTKLNNQLGTDFKTKWPLQGDSDCCPFIYDNKKLELKETKVVKYSGEAIKKIVTLQFQVKSTGQKLQVINTHVPTGRNGGPTELQTELQKATQTRIPTILMGDMNADTSTISKLLTPLSFTPVSKGEATHVNTSKTAIDYDQIHLYDPQKTIKSEYTNWEDELFADDQLQKDLLSSKDYLNNYF